MAARNPKMYTWVYINDVTTTWRHRKKSHILEKKHCDLGFFCVNQVFSRIQGNNLNIWTFLNFAPPSFFLKIRFCTSSATPIITRYHRHDGTWPTTSYVETESLTPLLFNFWTLLAVLLKITLQLSPQIFIKELKGS